MRGDLSRVANGSRCRRCDGTIEEVDLAVDLMVDGDTLDGADLAATARIRNGWMKFRVILLKTGWRTKKDMVRECRSRYGRI